MSKNDDIKVSFTPLAPGVEAKGKSIVQLDKEGKFVEAHAYGNFVEKIEGGMRLFRPDGSTVTMKDGDITIENLIAKSVGVRNLFEVESFAVRTVGQTRMCRMGFTGGGFIEVVYSQDGQVLELTSHKLEQSISNDNEVMVSQGDSTGGQAR